MSCRCNGGRRGDCGERLNAKTLEVEKATQLRGKTFISRLSAPARYLRAELSQDNVVPTDYTNFAPIAYDNVLTNSLSLGVSGSTFTIQESGNYSIIASIAWQDNAANTREIVVQVLNASNVVEYKFASATNVFGFQDSSSASGTLFIPAGFKVNVVARQVSGVQLNALQSKSTFIEISRPF